MAERRSGLRIAVSPGEAMDFLGSIPLLQQLPGTSLQKIVDVVEQLQFEKGEVLMREGTPEDGLYFLWRGKRSGEGFEHQEPMPHVPMPDQLLTQEDIRKRYFSDPRIPLKKRERLSSGRSARSYPLDVKEVDPIDEVSREPLPPWQSTWIKSKGKLTDEPTLHRCAAAYASDWTFLSTAWRPYRETLI